MTPRTGGLRSGKREPAANRYVAPGPATHKLGLRAGRDGLLHVPAGVDRGQPVPLVLMRHGAGGEAGQSVPLLVDEAEARDFLILAP